jgi:hypothetical protein
MAYVSRLTMGFEGLTKMASGMNPICLSYPQ